MTNLEALYIVYPISFTHIELKGLVKLRWLGLDIVENEIPQFDQVNPDLQVLYLRFECTHIGKEFKSKFSRMFLNFRKLQSFSFMGNHTFDFDLDWLHGTHLENSKQDDLSHTSSSLRYLRLCKLESIKGSCLRFSNLRTLKLSEIINFEFQPGMFNGLVNLKLIKIFKVNIKDKMLPAGTFNGLVNLERLTIRKCNLETLSDGCFSPLVRLQLLDLLYNSIVEQNAKTFIGLESLKELRLDYCLYFSLEQFKSLEEFFLRSLTKKIAKRFTNLFPNIELKKWDYEYYRFFE